MLIFQDPLKLQNYVKGCRRKSRRIGFVPTMGALHEGHVSLVRASKNECDRTMVSIFVNPLQFSGGEDYAVYPRDVKADLRCLKKEKTDCLFLPSSVGMYSDNFSTYVEETKLSQVLCGAFRPGHFKGVTTIVSKLFNMVEPDVAYFGRKDYQQALIIEKMADDLNYPVQVKMLPTVRDRDGVAMSSRNTYLSVEERMDAEYLYKALARARELIEKGEKKAAAIIQKAREILKTRKGLTVQYVEIRDAEDLAEVKIIDRSVVIALAVFAGSTRLIDNMLVRIRGNKVNFEL